MKNLLYTLILLPALFLFSGRATAQEAAPEGTTLTFFSQDGQRFFLIIDGQKQNDKPQTKVTIKGLKQPSVQTKFIFEDEKLKTHDERFYLSGVDPGWYDLTYSIAWNEKKKAWKTKMISWETQGKGPNKGIDAELKEDNAATDNAVKTGTQQSWDNSYETTTTNPGGTMKIDVNLPGTSVTTTNGSTTTTTKDGVTTTTTTVTTGGTINPGMNPGNTGNTNTGNTNSGNNNRRDHNRNNRGNGNNRNNNNANNGSNNNAGGCSRQMLSGDFQKALASIKATSFSDAKLNQAKLVAKNNCLSVAQVKLVIGELSFEQSKLDFAKYAYSHCTEKNNYYLVNDAFSFSSSKDELTRFLTEAE
ncbi:MAG: DUF4476 domain-containing protein [Bacteroidota bacterium]